ncbi:MULTISPECIES: hypothetical protein [Prescottella]|uniref:Secreted protein n=1 Tax=Rhodococcus hoagii TaxID=43767 RepID=A0AAE5CE14_RHOHA|nr:hypothetical protein [Prescottella equi]MBM4474135.1 hypothetical protein [Prescottella equi]MBM4493652.1 hypothetical protein [Prescottella equi]MBM4511835.1 hypothetical protein [Prescottella equi]MBM4541586.1 hypothetical protein [Prescottella equi]MBM4714124.1 hypothetical protein [Prescottella equi]
MGIGRRASVVGRFAAPACALAAMAALAAPAWGAPADTPATPPTDVSTSEPQDCTATGSASSASLDTGLGSEWSAPVSSATFGLSCSGSAVLLDLGSLAAFVGS